MVKRRSGRTIAGSSATIVKSKRKNKNRRAVERYAGDAYSLATRTWRGLNEIRKFINIEEKHFSLASTLSGAVPAGALTYASGIAQGTDLSNRIGNSLKVQSLHLMGRVAINPSATTFSVVRIILVRDNENPGSNPGVADIVDTVNTPITFVNYVNRKRFSFVFDELVVVDKTGNYSACFRASVPFERHIFYRSTGNAVGSAAEGALFWLAISDESTNTPDIKVNLEFSFTDD